MVPTPQQHSPTNVHDVDATDSRESSPLDPRIKPELRNSILDNLCHNPRFTPAASDALADLVSQYARTIIAPNLQAFSNHASRQTVTETDVLLMVRNYPEARARVQQALERFEDDQPPQRQRRPQQKRRSLSDTDDDDINNQPNVRRRRPVGETAPPTKITAVAAPPPPASSSSSSSDTESDSADDPPPARRNSKSSAQRAAEQFVDSSDEEDALMEALQNRTKPKRLKATTRRTAKKPKFRLPRSATSDKEDDSIGEHSNPKAASDEESAKFPQTQSRAIQDIMENLEEDSVASDCE